MRLRDADERDTEWETDTPAVRAYFWTHDRSHVSCVDVLDATVKEASDWAKSEAVARGADLDLAIRIENAQGLFGLVWLLGDGVSGQLS